LLRPDQVTVLGAGHCPYTYAARYILDRALIPYRDVHLLTEDAQDVASAVRGIAKETRYDVIEDHLLPAVFVGYRYLGGLEELKSL
jgi:glutaredoxin